MNKQILVLAVIAASAYWLIQGSNTAPAQQQITPATASDRLVIATTDIAVPQQTSAGPTNEAPTSAAPAAPPQQSTEPTTSVTSMPVAADPLLSANFSQQVALLTAQQPADVEKIEALQQYLTTQNDLHIRSSDISALNCSASVCLINLEPPQALDIGQLHEKMLAAGLGHTLEIQPVVANGVQQLRVKLTHGAAGQKALVITP
jgi:hypothetical protein